MRRLRFAKEAFVRGLYELSRAYGRYVASIAVVLVVTGVALPPILHWIPLRWTLPVGLILLALVVVEGAYRLWRDADDEAAKLKVTVDGWVNNLAATPARPRGPVFIDSTFTGAGTHNVSMPEGTEITFVRSQMKDAGGSNIHVRGGEPDPPATNE